MFIKDGLSYRYITVFRNANLRDFYVQPSDWKGGQEHADDILALAFNPPNSLSSASYDGEIVIWNNNSEQASKHMTQRSRRGLGGKQKTNMTTREVDNHVVIECLYYMLYFILCTLPYDCK